ncbi:hypothetical protein VITU102760_24840 [Vibrio tubiashii]|uniref:Uncharacterized protein n=1 Tax=Vibrio tubiashii ATCC 19109 TaxID=1051646 RepID=F9T6S4_9VIBR|nr:hypothetical protein [Vibrio tubiashii]AIW17488.1 hypothetical protein IX91_25870 [Vibrio tubiashii ATCC 19109]EGU54479.1 hypothetical protein VITU9109_02857 [Vibrio tubiashii ATCC 19109]EIF05998.1 hypothetical protein VT1337_00625 [Vibrio tubiashii NCIMB 1337 = ATCC 19106]
MFIQIIPKSEHLMYASTIESLEDIAKTDACKNKYIHCTFPYEQYEERTSLGRNLENLGVVGLLWGGQLKVSLNKPVLDDAA